MVLVVIIKVLLVSMIGMFICRLVCVCVICFVIFGVKIIL